MIKQILSPYPTHRSALTDCTKLLESAFPGRKAILIYGFDYEKWPLDPTVDAFVILAGLKAMLGECHKARFNNLVHPIHKQGEVFGWELKPLAI